MLLIRAHKSLFLAEHSLIAFPVPMIWKLPQFAPALQKSRLTSFLRPLFLQISLFFSLLTGIWPHRAVRVRLHPPPHSHALREHFLWSAEIRRRFKGLRGIRVLCSAQMAPIWGLLHWRDEEFLSRALCRSAPPSGGLARSLGFTPKPGVAPPSRS
jgi:hypothetical protein